MISNHWPLKNVGIPLLSGFYVHKNQNNAMPVILYLRSGIETDYVGAMIQQ
jgi:hypothetical protein